jgi:gluconokinase
MNVPELRSPYTQLGGLFYFPRMLDKIRLHAAGQLPQEYHANLGIGFDGRTLSFLWIDYPALVERVKQGGADDEIFAWAGSQGRRPSPEEIEIWNDFMRKRGWNDESSERLVLRKAESRLQDRTDIETFFDYIDADEGRAPVKRAASKSA